MFHFQVMISSSLGVVMNADHDCLHHDDDYFHDYGCLSYDYLSSPLEEDGDDDDDDDGIDLAPAASLEGDGDDDDDGGFDYPPAA